MKLLIKQTHTADKKSYERASTFTRRFLTCCVYWELTTLNTVNTFFRNYYNFRLTRDRRYSLLGSRCKEAVFVSYIHVNGCCYEEGMLNKKKLNGTTTKHY